MTVQWHSEESEQNGEVAEHEEGAKEEERVVARHRPAKPRRAREKRWRPAELCSAGEVHHACTLESWTSSGFLNTSTRTHHPIMVKALVGALALASLASLPSALAFRNTSPFFLFSTAEYAGVPVTVAFAS
jgi:hypothetical protein